MEDLVERIAGGHVTDVKVVLSSVILALAVYQLVLITVGYGKVKPPFLGSSAALRTHRAVGDTIVVLILLVSFMCLAYFGFEDDTRELVHGIAGVLLLAVLAVKIAVIRWWHDLGRYLPILGTSVFALLLITWLTSTADYFWGS